MNDIYQVIHLKLGVILVGAVTTMSKVALSSGFEKLFFGGLSIKIKIM